MSRAACVLKGIDWFEPDFSKDIIQKIGHGGSFLMDPSTMKHCRNFWTPEISTMDSHDDWEKKGSMDVVQKANYKFKEILALCPERIIEQDVDKDLEAYIAKKS